MNLAELLEGPAVLYYKGQYFESAGGGIVNASNEARDVPSDRYGPIARRANARSITVEFNPIGVWNDDVLPILFPYTNPTFGEFITPVTTFTSSNVNTSNEQITCSTAKLRTGTPVRLGSFGTLPTGLDKTTLYYVKVVSSGVITLHPTLADAVAGTNTVDITNAGSGNHAMIEQEPLIVWPDVGGKITFHVAGLVQMPTIRFSTQQTLLGAIRFECFGKNNVAWSTANSLYTVETAALSVTPPDPDEVPTQEYALSWGSSPWDSFTTRDEIEVSFNLQLAEVSSDQRGVQTRKITALEAIVRAVPTGISEDAILTALALQGGSVGRGVDITGNDFEISGTGVFVRIYNAGLRQGPLRYNPNDPRAGQLEWASIRSFSGGSLQPVLLVATAEPSS